MINLPTLHTRMEGYYRLQVHDGLTGEMKGDTGWFKNLITDEGLDWHGGGVPVNNTSLGALYINTHATVGTGNATPSFSDTALQSPISVFPPNGSNVEGFSSSSFAAGPPAYWSGIFTYSFPTGGVVGNVAEVGVGGMLLGDTQVRLYSRALVVDGSGNPTTIAVTITDALTLTYELRHYLDLTDNTYSVSINGVTYGGTYRRAEVTTIPNYFFQCDYDFNGISFAANFNVYNGTIGTVTGFPSGTPVFGRNNFTTVAASYTPGTHFKSFVTTVPLGTGNVSGGISAIEFFTTLGSWQFGVTPPIPKDSTKVMTLSWNVSWARYP